MDRGVWVNGVKEPNGGPVWVEEVWSRPRDVLRSFVLFGKYTNDSLTKS